MARKQSRGQEPDGDSPQEQPAAAGVTGVLEAARLREQIARAAVAPEPIRPKRPPVPQDVIPPMITAASLLEGHKHHMANIGKIKLRRLARTNPEVAALIKQTGTSLA